MSIKILASAVGAMDIDDSEPPAHCCVPLSEPGPTPAAHPEAPSAAPPQDGGPDSLVHTKKAPVWSERLRHCLQTLRRHRSVLLLAVAVLALMAGGSTVCVAYRAELLEAGAYIRRHAPLSAVYYSLVVALWIVLCLPSTIIELGAYVMIISDPSTKPQTRPTVSNFTQTTTNQPINQSINQSTQQRPG